MDILTDFLLPYVVYSGPVLPSIGILIIKLRIGMYPYKRTIIILFCIHILAFVPFVIASLQKHPDFLHALFFPALTGVVTFIYGIVLMTLSIILPHKAKLDKNTITWHEPK